MYVRITDNQVVEIIAEFVPEFPDADVFERYSREYLSGCMHVPDGTPVLVGWFYEPSDGTFRDDAYSEVTETYKAQMEALERENKALLDKTTVLEECLVELAGIVYA